LAKLARRKIGDALKEQLAEAGWNIRSRVSGSIRAHAPQDIAVDVAREEITRRVQALGYIPTIVSDRKSNGDVCITFTTPEITAEAGIGSQRAPASTEAQKRIAAMHEMILQEALRWRDAHPDFTFNLRTGDITGQNRLAEGYWFPGSNYLFFAPFKPHDANNKTRTLGFVIKMNRQGEARSTYMEVVFGSGEPLLRPVN
jgi:hypothetical protein